MHGAASILSVASAGVAGLFAGAAGRLLLARIQRGVLASPPWCELAVAALWTLAAIRASEGHFPVWWLPLPLAVAWFAVLLSATDLRHHRLPDLLTLPLGVLVILLVLLAQHWGAGPGVLFRAVLGGLAYGGGYALLHLLAPHSLGAGDVKLAGSLGVVLGAVSFSALLLGPVLAAALTLGLALLQRSRFVAHGPGMLGSAWILITFPAADALSAV